MVRDLRVVDWAVQAEPSLVSQQGYVSLRHEVEKTEAKPCCEERTHENSQK